MDDNDMSTNVLIVPGYHGSGDAHWQSWLEARLPQARRVTGIDWEVPALYRWAEAVINDLDNPPYPSIIVAHSFGCLASALAIAHRPRRVAGVILVAPADPQRFALSGPRNPAQPRELSIAWSLPENALNTPGLVVGSRNDPWMKLQHAHAWAKRWGLPLHDAGSVGHINVDAGFGPWPWIEQITAALCEKVALSHGATQHWGHGHEVARHSTAPMRLLYA
ncbi:RBBP9/YdeN family alpha/beta hydrolase [Sedimenticola hydrogenitrophicus]|uniref:RBBP9/YdeN family alpha/beta hydrolase n=1 Tax=Sedimenticola hydrogenitrophicus TaxID=2967975 RepID=UPI0023B1879C|nr:alpha/beta hydrolase [Sedimenticola hydrogenitrophicus]